MLQVIFGDDEHTAAEGPYARLLKTRKWLYFSSVATFVVAWGLYDETALQKAMGFIKLPATTLLGGLSFGLAYLLFQYVLLVVQLLATYDIILAERFTFRRADELARARDRALQARKSYQEALSAFNKDAKRSLSVYRERLQGELSELEKKRAGEKILLIHKEINKEISGIAELRYSISRANVQIALRTSRIGETINDPDTAASRIEPVDDAEMKIAIDAQDEAERDLTVLQHQVPSERRLYKSAERTIDASRVGLPMIIAASALYAAAVSQLWLDFTVEV